MAVNNEDDTEYGGNQRGAFSRIPFVGRDALGRPIPGRGGTRADGDGTDSEGRSIPLTVEERARAMRMHGMRPELVDRNPDPAEARDELIQPGSWAERQRQRKEMDRQTSRYWTEGAMDDE